VTCQPNVEVAELEMPTPWLLVKSITTLEQGLETT
jgi:hypothetical protein